MASGQKRKQQLAAVALPLACALPLGAPFAEGGEEILPPLSKSHRVNLLLLCPQIDITLFIHSSRIKYFLSARSVLGPEDLK